MFDRVETPPSNATNAHVEQPSPWCQTNVSKQQWSSFPTRTLVVPRATSAPLSHSLMSFDKQKEGPAATRHRAQPKKQTKTNNNKNKNTNKNNPTSQHFAVTHITSDCVLLISSPKQSPHARALVLSLARSLARYLNLRLFDSAALSHAPSKSTPLCPVQTASRPKQTWHCHPAHPARPARRKSSKTTVQAALNNAAVAAVEVSLCSVRGAPLFPSLPTTG